MDDVDRAWALLCKLQEALALATIRAKSLADLDGAAEAASGAGFHAPEAKKQPISFEIGKYERRLCGGQAAVLAHQQVGGNRES